MKNKNILWIVVIIILSIVVMLNLRIDNQLQAVSTCNDPCTTCEDLIQKTQWVYEGTCSVSTMTFCAADLSNYYPSEWARKYDTGLPIPDNYGCTPTTIPGVTTTTIQTTCTDSDGTNIHSKGSVSGVNIYNQPYTYYDYCPNSYSVYEYQCNMNSPQKVYTSCPSGYSCSGGACIYAPTTTTIPAVTTTTYYYPTTTTYYYPTTTLPLCPPGYYYDAGYCMPIISTTTYPTDTLPTTTLPTTTQPSQCPEGYVFDGTNCIFQYEKLSCQLWEKEVDGKCETNIVIVGATIIAAVAMAFI